MESSFIEDGSLVAAPPEDLRRLHPEIFEHRMLDPLEITAIFKACGAFWEHPGKNNPRALHVSLASGKHSSRYVACPNALQHPNICEVMAGQIILRLKSIYYGSIGFVVGSDSAGLNLAYEVARQLGVPTYPMQKGPDKTQIWEAKVDIPEGTWILHVEELMTTAGTAQKVRAAIRESNPHKVNFIPFLPVIVHRPAPDKEKECSDVDGSRVLHLIHYDIPAWEPDECPLCERGSPVTTNPKGDWGKLIESMI